jgi:hypothetical protein
MELFEPMIKTMAGNLKKVDSKNQNLWFQIRNVQERIVNLEEEIKNNDKNSKKDCFGLKK